jgi:hypothetical protein
MEQQKIGLCVLAAIDTCFCRSKILVKGRKNGILSLSGLAMFYSCAVAPAYFASQNAEHFFYSGWQNIIYKTTGTLTEGSFLQGHKLDYKAHNNRKGKVVVIFQGERFHNSGDKRGNNSRWNITGNQKGARQHSGKTGGGTFKTFPHHK